MTSVDIGMGMGGYTFYLETPIVFTLLLNAEGLELNLFKLYYLGVTHGFTLRFLVKMEVMS